MRSTPLHDVVRLERVFGGDTVTEDLVLRLIATRWGARNLFSLPTNRRFPSE
jgi:hypothetical protein